MKLAQRFLPFCQNTAPLFMIGVMLAIILSVCPNFSQTKRSADTTLIKSMISDTTKVSSAKPKPLYFEITDGMAMVYTAVDPQSTILGMAHKGSRYPIVEAGEAWILIKFGEDQGWIDRRFGKLTDAPVSEMSRKIPGIIIFALAGSIIGIVAIVFLVMFVMRLFQRKTAGVFVRKNVLIITAQEKHITNALTNQSHPLENCFSELGFNVSRAHSLSQAEQSLVSYYPDLILIDWLITENIQLQLSSILKSRTSVLNAFIIFYNAPDPATIEQITDLPNVNYLGTSFTDRDIFRVVTPLIVNESSPANIRKSVQTSALQGNIAESNLSEIFQFLEIGHKTGVLTISKTHPLGSVFFQDGRIVYAATPYAIGKDAVFEVLNLPEGRFTFLLGKQPPEQNLNISTLELLMEWAKASDEARRT